VRTTNVDNVAATAPRRNTKAALRPGRGATADAAVRITALKASKY
jgi:hypothetical protein